MIDHVYISVSDIDRAAAFYVGALEPLGWKEIGTFESTTDYVPDLFGFCDRAYGSGKAIGCSIWLRKRKEGETGLYLGLVADTRAEVDAAYAAALSAGGQDDGVPGVRAYFDTGYYAANVTDLDGNRLEFVTKRMNPKRPV
ncbi:VOC family protein [Streptomyces violascens]|uniref:VOC family protein n=1 Tax=Streptomyces violascens TaxID=67381 RepID=UPI00379AD316